jgi:hypothetical protein
VTILESMRHLEERLDTFKTLASAANQSKAYRTRAAQLLPISSLLSRLDTTSDAMRSAGLQVPEARLFFSDKLAGRVMHLRKAFENAPDSILTSEANVEQTFLTPIRDGLANWEKALKACWQDCVMARLGDLPQDLVDVLRSVPQFSAGIKELREIQSLGVEISTSLPADAAIAASTLLHSVDDLASKKERLIKELQGVPSEVVAFIAGCASGRGKLTDLTPGIHAWITDNGLLQSFRVAL